MNSVPFACHFHDGLAFDHDDEVLHQLALLHQDGAFADQ